MSSLALDLLRCPRCHHWPPACPCPEPTFPIEPHPSRRRETGDRALYLCVLGELGRFVVSRELGVPV